MSANFHNSPDSHVQSPDVNDFHCYRSLLGCWSFFFLRLLLLLLLGLVFSLYWSLYCRWLRNFRFRCSRFRHGDLDLTIRGLQFDELLLCSLDLLLQLFILFRNVLDLTVNVLVFDARELKIAWKLQTLVDGQVGTHLALHRFERLFGDPVVCDDAV